MVLLNLPVPVGVQHPGRGDKGCGTGGLPCETGSREFEFLSSVETTEKRGAITNGPLSRVGARALVLTTTRNYKNAIDVRRQGIMHINAVPRTRYRVPQETVTA